MCGCSDAERRLGAVRGVHGPVYPILKPCVREWISSETKASSGWEERNRAKTCGRRGVCGACEVMGGGGGGGCMGQVQ